MSQKTVQIQMPFQALVEAIASLTPEQKHQLWQLLNQEITQHLSQKNNGSDDFLTKEILTMTEIKSRYPNQWLLIGEPEIDENLNIIRGQVLASSPDEYEIYNSLSQFHVKSKAIEYTGSIPEDLTVLM